MMKRDEIKKLLSGLGDPKEIAEQLEQFRADCRFMRDHWAEFLERHPLQWVAVFEGKVVAVANTLEEVIRRVQESGASGASSARVSRS